MDINTLEAFGSSLLSFCELAAVVYFLAKILKVKYNGYKFTNPQKSALYAIVAVTISASIVTGLMIFIKSQNTSEVTSIIRNYNLGSVTNIVISWLMMLTPILIVKRIRKESWGSTGITKHNLKQSILIGTILALITIASVLLFSSSSVRDIGQKLTLSALWALVYYAVVGFCEEFMFRGYLQIRLMGWIGRWKGWILTSIVMALVHIPQRMAIMGLPPQEAIISAVLLIPISLTMGFILIKTENIVAPGIYHTFADWVVLLM